jgi:hypothetical protein
MTVSTTSAILNAHLTDIHQGVRYGGPVRITTAPWQSWWPSSPANCTGDTKIPPWTTYMDTFHWSHQSIWHSKPPTTACPLLQKYRAPDKLVRAVKMLYADISAKIQVGKKMWHPIHHRRSARWQHGLGAICLLPNASLFWNPLAKLERRVGNQLPTVPIPSGSKSMQSEDSWGQNQQQWPEQFLN